MLIVTLLQQYIVEQMQNHLNQAMFELTKNRMQDESSLEFNDGYYSAINDMDKKVEEIVRLFEVEDMLKFFAVKMK